LEGRRRNVDPDADLVRVERVATLSWLPVIVVGAMVALIGVAIWKPWDGPGTRVAQPAAAQIDTPAGGSSVQPRPSATDDPEILAAINRAFCGKPPEWRLLTTETGPLGDTRTLYGTAPLAASGPTDPGIPTANVAATRLFSIGVCRPLTGGREPAPDGSHIEVSLWRVDAVGTAVLLPPPVVLDKALYSIGEAYYGPPLAQTDRQLTAGVTRGWAPGRYVLDILNARPDGTDVWFGLDFRSASSVPAAGGLPAGT
jgi:hypothetical protein